MMTTITITTHPAFPRHRERLTVCEVVGSRTRASLPTRMLEGVDAEAYFRRVLALAPNEQVKIREVEA